jgi:SAM-dependent methyltransferase
MSGYPLDLQRVSYAYLERPNHALISLLYATVLRDKPAARVLDVGCGYGANARTIRMRWPGSYVTGIEPHAAAAAAARAVCDTVFHGTLQDWIADDGGERQFDAVLLSDVLEHVADPVAWLRAAAAVAPLRGSTWIISVPNFGVWYNRVSVALGRFDYMWSGLYDRTHLRFYTRKSIQRLLEYCGFEMIARRGSASLVQAFAPLLRKRFASSVGAGDHLALAESPLYRAYARIVEPVEEAVCNIWPSLLSFQTVTACRRK